MSGVGGVRGVRGTALAAGMALLAACGTASGGDGREVVSYWLWDANQQPGYQACADDFEARHPGIDIQIRQIGWDDYWTTLNLAFVAESAPDVFTDHVAKYPDFATRELLLPLDDFVARDEVPLDVYEAGLAELWLGEDGQRYGLPKDWDTVGVFYNRDKLREAGITDEEMRHLTWNPQDGGTYEDVIARLTVDVNGVRGDEPGFDPNHVATYGLWLDGGGGQVGSSFGQTQWSMYTGATGWTATDRNPWGTHFNFDDPRFKDTIGWWRSLIEKGYMPSLPEQEGVQWSDQLAAGTTAMATSGSWMISTAFGYEGLDVGLAPTPVGPEGERSTMFNGLADSINAATDSPEEAWAWVRYLGSLDCQRVVADEGVVFPAITEAWEIKQRNYAAEGIDVTPFTTQVADGTTFPFPIAENPGDITSELTRTMESVLGGAPLDSFDGLNRRVNALFGAGG